MITVKEMLDSTLVETGFAPLAQYFGNNRQEARQLSALANRELNQYGKDEWQVLRTQYTITMTASNTYPLPTDYRQFVPDTPWTETRRVDFPVTSEVWIYYNARNITTGLRQRMRLAKGQIELQDPDPGSEILIEYISNSPVLDNTMTPQVKFTADDDMLALNDDLFILGMVWRWMKVKGLDWQPNYQEWRRMYKRQKAADSGSQTIQTALTDWEGPWPPTADLWQGTQVGP